MNAFLPYNATVMARIDITPRLTILQVRPDDLDFSFIAGQYTVLGLLRSAQRIPESRPEETPGGDKDKLIKRAYSISSGSITRKYLEFYIALVSDGALTPRLFAVSGGDRIFMGGRFKGMFTLEKAPEDKNVLMAATGTGIAPYVSMLRSQVLAGTKRRIAVLHGASYSWDLGFRNELEEMASRCKGFVYAPVVSRPKESHDWKGMSGRLPSWLNNPGLGKVCGFDIAPATTHVFLCGNPRMIEDAALILAGQGFRAGDSKNPGNLHFEKFW